jgi:small subunit ribosomal protein S6
MFIIANNVTEEKRNTLVDKFSKMAGAGVKVEKMGLKKFATEIDHKKDGYYYLMTFASEPQIPHEIGALMNITDGMVRYMFVNKDEQIKGRKQNVKKAKPKAEAKSE